MRREVGVQVRVGVRHTLQLQLGLDLGSRRRRGLFTFGLTAQGLAFNLQRRLRARVRTLTELGLVFSEERL